MNARVLPALRDLVVGTLLVGTCMGSSCFGNDSGDTSGTMTSTGPSIEVTVDGTHVGPYAAGSDAYADLTTNRDDSGQIDSTMLVLHATGVTTATCDLTLQRFGADIAGFSANAYSVTVPTTDTTPDRTASLAGQISVTGGALTLTCGGDDCGALFVINVLDSAHVEGYLTATMQDPSDGQSSSVVVTFYVPWRTYSP